MTRLMNITAAGAVAIAAAISAPSTFAYPAPGDPGASAVSQSRPANAQDLRSPDARDAAIVAKATPPAQDLRSPDTRVATSGPSHFVPSASNGFAWGDAGVGAAVMLALVSLCGGVATRIGRSRRRQYVARAI